MPKNPSRIALAVRCSATPRLRKTVGSVLMAGWPNLQCLSIQKLSILWG